MKIAAITSFLESLAHPSLQENYDNAGLITGNKNWECTGIVCTLDATEEVVQEAIRMKCNLVVAHHPIVFSGLKRINGNNYVERTIISAIKNDISIYAIHTNLDNVIAGVNGRIALKLGLTKLSLLAPRQATLKKIYTFVPSGHADIVRNALFAIGGGQIGNYSECSFNVGGTGTFRAGPGASPYVGDVGAQHQENEVRIEMVFPSWLEASIVSALKEVHPYEEVAYDILNLANAHPGTGSGLIGELELPVDPFNFLSLLKDLFQTPVIRHTALLSKPVKKVALCGGAGSFLISAAAAAGADFYITSDVKYHEFFDANGQMVIADIGHYESEQFTIDLLKENLEQKFLNFAVLKTGVQTNPVQYFNGR